MVGKRQTGSSEMNVQRKILGIFCVLFMPTILYAYSTLTLTLENKSSEVLEWEQTLVNNPGNTLQVKQDKIFPGETGIIIGAISQNFDLSGTIIFKGDIRLRVLDQRFYHMGQPIFRIMAPRVESEVISKTLNSHKAPRLLQWTATHVVVEDKS